MIKDEIPNNKRREAGHNRIRLRSVNVDRDKDNRSVFKMSEQGYITDRVEVAATNAAAILLPESNSTSPEKTNANISLATCRGCGAKILVWGSSPNSICYKCEQQQRQQNTREQVRIDKWV